MRRAAALTALALGLLAPAAQASPPNGPPIVSVSQGAGLFAANCARCHGPTGEGVTKSEDPALRGILALGDEIGRAHV